MPAVKHPVLLPLLRFPRLDALRHLEREEGLEIWVDGRPLYFHEDATRVLQRAFRKPWPTVDQVVESCAPVLTQARVLELLADLIKKGILYMQENGGLK